jgi:hypothetical protein
MDEEAKRKAKDDQRDGADMTDALQQYVLHPGTRTLTELLDAERACIMAPVLDVLIGQFDNDAKLHDMDRMVADLVACSGSRIAFMPFSLKAVEIGIDVGRHVRLFVDPSKKEAPEIIITEVRVEG